MLEQMKLIKPILVTLMLFSICETQAQTETYKEWSGETYLLSSFYRLGSYNHERPTLFLEQSFDYRLNKQFSAGLGIGINLYPALLGAPISVNAKYHFTIKSVPFSFNQSLGRNIRWSDSFFASNRNMGEIRANIPLNNITFNPRLGYNFLWEKYGGGNLSFFLGIGIEYKLKKVKN